MVIAAFQRIRGLIGYRFGDVMRLIIEPAAGARASARERSVYSFFLWRGQRCVQSDHFQDGEVRVISIVVGPSAVVNTFYFIYLVTNVSLVIFFRFSTFFAGVNYIIQTFVVFDINTAVADPSSLFFIQYIILFIIYYRSYTYLSV